MCPHSCGNGKRRGASVVVVAVVVCAMAICVFAVVSYGRSRKERSLRQVCLVNLKCIGLGLMQYAADYDQHFPPAGNWTQSHSYGSPAEMVCPVVGGKIPCYAMNRNLSCISTKTIGEPGTVVGAFDSAPGANMSGGAELLPKPGRHMNGSSIGFADGHVTWHKDGVYSDVKWTPLLGGSAVTSGFRSVEEAQRVADKASGTPAPPTGSAQTDSVWDQIRMARIGIHSYKATQQRSGGLTQYFKMRDGRPVRMFVVAYGQWFLVQLDTNVAYVYKPEHSVAMRTSAMASMQNPRLYDILLLQGGHRKVTSGTLDGMDCWIISETGKHKGWDTIWVDKKQGLIRQTRTGKHAEKLKVEDVNGVPDSKFELPAGAKVRDMSKSPQRYQGGVK